MVQHIPNVDPVTRVKIADLLVAKYNLGDSDAHEWHMNDFNTRVEEILGDRPIADHPLDAPKQMRAFIKGLEPKTLWEMLQYLINKDGIDFTEVLEGSGIRVMGTKLVTIADFELGVYKTNEVITELEKLGWNDVKTLLTESASQLAESDPISASAKAGLAFDSVAKKALALFGVVGTESLTLTKLVEALASSNIIETEAKQALIGLATLRNKQPGHSGTGGLINLSTDLAYMTTYLSRIAIGYLIKRLHTSGKI